jgi:hypothetical protein
LNCTAGPGIGPGIDVKWDGESCDLAFTWSQDFVTAGLARA